MTNIEGIEIYQENEMWYVTYSQNNVVMPTESFDTEEEAITFSLNLKFISLEG